MDAMVFAPADSTLHSVQQARAVLERAIAVAGGEDRLRRLRTVTLHYTGHRTMINQSRQAYPPWDREPASGSVVVDREGERMFAENYTSYPGIGRFGAAWAVRGDQGVHWEPDRNHYGSEVIATYSGRETAGPWALATRWIPPLILIDAWDCGTNLRRLGRVTRDDLPMDAVAWTQRDGGTVTLLVETGTGVVHGFESVRGDGVYGDVTDRVAYSDWRRVGGVVLPAKRTDRCNDEVVRELDLEYGVDLAVEDDRFELPPGYTRPRPAPDRPDERLREVADGVYLDPDGVMVVEFGDFLAVADCPDDYHRSRSTIAALRERFPDKPVRYVVPSHTHGDHGGGARAYFEIGATVLTTPGHVEFYRTLARPAPRTISPDPYVATDDGPPIEAFRGTHVISDNVRTMVLHDVGPNAHSEELTIVHLPDQGVVWQADIFFSPATGGGLNPAMPITVDFAEKLAALGITTFTALLEAHHGRVVSVEEFRQALALADYRGY
ncbi:MBL fold metallo-hydrolase [Jiangella alkaliphila]|uniref:Glyoxylase, beta-lactamase superfamily II n=1 Tax=Jiangella alkaliphila TaxID=419479 RepID=A0A1H2JJ94_9ACTN|nr:MBL fold metallo-hydrolase [Jiangella alkaliphila]SDU56539.1 Glyoxylase, beta-lactamase superfamily II [Jiangella alkaliphila]